MVDITEYIHTYAIKAIHQVITYKDSFHLIEHNSLVDYPGAVIMHILMFQPPAFLPTKCMHSIQVI